MKRGAALILKMGDGSPPIQVRRPCARVVEYARHPVVTTCWSADIARQMTTCFGMDEGLTGARGVATAIFRSGLFLKEWRMNNSNQTGTTLERLRRDWAVMTFTNASSRPSPSSFQR